MPSVFRDIVRAAKKSGCAVEASSGGSSHYKIRLPNGDAYPISAHNGERSEIADVYVKKLAQKLGLTLEQFRALM